MKTRILGRTGIRISALSLGTMMLGKMGNTDHDEGVRIIRRALDAGINLIDTADTYSQGESEVIVGKALAGINRDDVVLATKVNNPMGHGINTQGSSRRWITAELDNSLRRLGVDHVDLYQLHRPDATVELEETLSALTDLQRAGKIRAFGTSTFPAHLLVKSQWVSERRHLSRFVSEQPPYSILCRAIEADVLPVAQEHGIGVLSWSPLAGGQLSGKYGIGKENASHRAGGRYPERYDPNNEANHRKFEILTALDELAQKAGLTLIDMAYAFVLNHPAISSVLVGPRTLEHLEPLLQTPEITLSPEVLDEIDRLVPPGTIVPGHELGYTPPALENAALRRREGN